MTATLSLFGLLAAVVGALLADAGISRTTWIYIGIALVVMILNALFVKWFLSSLQSEPDDDEEETASEPAAAAAVAAAASTASAREAEAELTRTTVGTPRARKIQPVIPGSAASPSPAVSDVAERDSSAPVRLASAAPGAERDLKPPVRALAVPLLEPAAAPVKESELKGPISLSKELDKQLGANPSPGTPSFPNFSPKPSPATEKSTSAAVKSPTAPLVEAPAAAAPKTNPASEKSAAALPPVEPAAKLGKTTSGAGTSPLASSSRPPVISPMIPPLTPPAADLIYVDKPAAPLSSVTSDPELAASGAKNNPPPSASPEEMPKSPKSQSMKSPAVGGEVPAGSKATPSGSFASTADKPPTPSADLVAPSTPKPVAEPSAAEAAGGLILLPATPAIPAPEKPAAPPSAAEAAGGLMLIPPAPTPEKPAGDKLETVKPAPAEPAAAVKPATEKPAPEPAPISSSGAPSLKTRLFGRPRIFMPSGEKEKAAAAEKEVADKAAADKLTADKAADESKAADEKKALVAVEPPISSQTPAPAEALASAEAKALAAPSAEAPKSPEAKLPVLEAKPSAAISNPPEILPAAAGVAQPKTEPAPSVQPAAGPPSAGALTLGRPEEKSSPAAPAAKEQSAPPAERESAAAPSATGLTASAPPTAAMASVPSVSTTIKPTVMPPNESTSVTPAGGRASAQLTLGFEITSLQLTPFFKLGAVQVKSLSNIVSLHLISSQQAENPLAAGISFQIAQVELNEASHIKSILLKPQPTATPAAAPHSKLQVNAVQLTQGSEGAPIQVTAQGTSVQLLATCTIAAMDFTPAFEIASLRLEPDSNTVLLRLAASQRPTALDLPPVFEVASIQLEGDAQIGSVRLTPAASKPS